MLCQIDNTLAAEGGDTLKLCRSCGTGWDSQEQSCPECGGAASVDPGEVPSPRGDQFRAEVQQCLEPLTAALTKELRRIAKKTLEEETHLIDFEVHSHGYPGYEEAVFTFLIRWDAMDESLGQLDDGGTLLRGRGVALPRELYGAPQYQEFDQNEAAFQVLVDWFADCWEQAGGHQCRYPAYISHHDSPVSFDLKAKHWVRNNAKWPRDA